MNGEQAERQLEKALLTEREKCLIGLSYGGEATDEAFRTLTDGLDLDTANQNYLLMLSCLGFAKGWERFPPEMVPRLKGMHRYHQAYISMGIPWLVRQIRGLADEGIPVMLLKGAALRACYAPDRPRIMYDYDFAVPEEQFDRALELLLGGGNTLGDKYPHSFSLKGTRHEIDLHRWIFKMHNEQFSSVWNRAEKLRFYGADVYVPAPEDMFIHLLDNQSLNYIGEENPSRRIQWLYDCRDVWEYSGTLDLERLAIRARELHIPPRTRMMLKFFVRCFPGLVEPEKFERCFPPSPEYDGMLVNYKKVKDAYGRYRRYGYNSRSAMTPLHIWRTLRVQMVRYHCLKTELRSMGPHMNFIRYMRMSYGLEEFSDLQRYFSHFRLFEKRSGGG